MTAAKRRVARRCSVAAMCDSVVALGVETVRGHTLFAKNSDRKPEECQPFVQHEAAHHAPGSQIRCTHVEIPQVAETYSVMGHSPWWVWGFEHGVNEHGVAVGNHTVFSNDPIEENPGLIGMDLVRLGLERGRTAREALEVIATLIETHGQGGAALAPHATGYHNSFLLADPGNAWRLETSNRHWVARQVRLEACSNHYGLDATWDIASSDFETWARRSGYWNRDDRVDVADALRNPHVPPHVSEGRARRARELLEGGRGSLDVAAFTALLRDHGEGGGVWTNGRARHDEERFFTLCAHSDPIHHTTASLVAELPDRHRMASPVWVGFAAPCTGLFLPVYLGGTLPACLARAEEEAGAPAAWARFKRLDEVAARDPVRSTPRIREGWAQLEREIEAERPDVECAARAACDANEITRASDLLGDFMERTAHAALERAVALTIELESPVSEAV
jgi:dipeptidase